MKNKLHIAWVSNHIDHLKILPRESMRCNSIERAKEIFGIRNVTYKDENNIVISRNIRYAIYFDAKGEKTFLWGTEQMFIDDKRSPKKEEYRSRPHFKKKTA